MEMEMALLSYGGLRADRKTPLPNNHVELALNRKMLREIFADEDVNEDGENTEKDEEKGEENQDDDGDGEVKAKRYKKNP